MSNTKTVTRAVVAVILVIGVCVLISINPWVSVGLAPILLAIAVILRTIGDDAKDTDNKTAKDGPKDDESTNDADETADETADDETADDETADDEEEEP